MHSILQQVVVSYTQVGPLLVLPSMCAQGQQQALLLQHSCIATSAAVWNYGYFSRYYGCIKVAIIATVAIADKKEKKSGAGSSDGFSLDLA